MREVYLDESRLNECLKMLLANRLVWSTKEEYADFFEYRALLMNNPLSKLPYAKKLERFLLIEKENILYGGYSESLEEALESYEKTSVFYHDCLAGKPVLKRKELAFELVRCFYQTMSLTGDAEIDSVLELLYDFDEDHYTPQGARVCEDWLVLMLLEVVPPMSSHSPRRDPDFEAEWRIVEEFIRKCLSLNPLYQIPEVLKTIQDELADRKNRILFFWAITKANSHLLAASSPEGLEEGVENYDIDGLWQDYVGDSPRQENVYYEMSLGTSFLEIREMKNHLEMTSYAYCFVKETDKISLFTLTHPEGCYQSIIGEKISPWNLIRFSFQFIRKKGRIEEIHLIPADSPQRSDLKMCCLIRVSEEDADKVYKRWEGKEKKDLYAKYTSYYPEPHGVAAITKSHIYISVPEAEGVYYRVPKAIDSRLQTITVDSMAGLCRVGEMEDYWIGFESIILYINREHFAELGIDRVTEIT
ncbi:MAG: hypothetical protein J6M23_06975 [Bacteroidales bacterium]|nr:hypothetical protein [Bacteroidales bacterium]